MTFNRRFCRPLPVFVLLISWSVGAAAEEQWARFRGPNGTGVSATTNLPTEFEPKKRSLEDSAPARTLFAGADRNPHFPHGAYPGEGGLVSQDGTVSAVSAQRDCEILAVNPLQDEVFGTPAIADGKLYMRTRNTLYCFGK